MGDTAFPDVSLLSSCVVILESSVYVCPLLYILFATIFDLLHEPSKGKFMTSTLHLPKPFVR